MDTKPCPMNDLRPVANFLTELNEKIGIACQLGEDHITVWLPEGNQEFKEWLSIFLERANLYAEFGEVPYDATAREFVRVSWDYRAVS